MKKKFIAGLAMGLLAVGLAGVANANLVANGSFETGVYDTSSTDFNTLAKGNAALADWSITDGTVDWINSYWTASNSTRSLDMSGLSQGTISTTFVTVKGAKYDVSFDMAGNPDNGPSTKTLQALVGAQLQNFVFNTEGHTRANMGWMNNTFSFTASDTSTTLSFHDLSTNADGNYYGAALDNVIVNASPVPEPATTLLFGVGVAGFAGVVRRRKLSLT